jgi:bis(5'-nucleosidyl)-tetraphosphatase
MNEKSAGAIVFRKGNNEIKYLLLHYHQKGDYWDFARGNVEKDETEEQTALREVHEETGITQLNFMPNFSERINWFYMRDKNRIYKEVLFFLAETEQDDVILSKEHVGYAWLNYDKALKKLTFRNAQELLKKAHAQITQED